MDYDEINISKIYNQGRELLGETMQIWLESIGKWIPKTKIKKILDIGCGTGRFFNR